MAVHHHLLAAALVAGAMAAMPALAQREIRLYQTDSTGNVQYHKPSFVIQSDGRVIETDAVGNRLYHRQQYQLQGNQVVPVDSLGNVQQHKKGLMQQPGR